MDPIEKLSNEQMRQLHADLVVQLEKGTAMRPVLWMLVQARKRAARAMVMFVDADPIDTSVISKLQAEVRLYDDMVRSCRELLAAGREAELKIGEDDRMAIDEIVNEMSEEDRRLYQLQQRGAD